MKYSSMKSLVIFLTLKVASPIPQLTTGKDLIRTKRYNVKMTLDQSYDELKSIVATLKDFVHEDYVEICRFCVNEADLKRRLTSLRDFISDQAFSRTKRNECDYAAMFLGCMHEVSAAFSLKCEYWGSNIVEDMGRLSVSILRLYRIEGEEVNVGYHREIARFEDRFSDLQYQFASDTKIPVETQQTIEMYVKDVKKALEITKANMRFNIQRAGGIFCKGGYLREPWSL